MTQNQEVMGPFTLRGDRTCYPRDFEFDFCLDSDGKAFMMGQSIP